MSLLLKTTVVSVAALTSGVLALGPKSTDPTNSPAATQFDATAIMGAINSNNGNTCVKKEEEISDDTAAICAKAAVSEVAEANYESFKTYLADRAENGSTESDKKNYQKILDAFNAQLSQCCCGFSCCCCATTWILTSLVAAGGVFSYFFFFTGDEAVVPENDEGVPEGHEIVLDETTGLPLKDNDGNVVTRKMEAEEDDTGDKKGGCCSTPVLVVLGLLVVLFVTYSCCSGGNDADQFEEADDNFVEDGDGMEEEGY